MERANGRAPLASGFEPIQVIDRKGPRRHFGRSAYPSRSRIDDPSEKIARGYRLALRSARMGGTAIMGWASGTSQSESTVRSTQYTESVGAQSSGVPSR